MSRYDSRSTLQKCIDQYIHLLQLAQGDKNPLRRKAIEEDILYALQAAEPYKSRFDAVFCYDLFALNGDCERAVKELNAALAVLQQVKAAELLPSRVESPRIILAECAMTLIDTLRSMGAFEPGAVEVLIGEVFSGFDPERAPQVLDRRLKLFMQRYIHDKIPESVLDKIAMEEAFLQEYLELL
jgi:hypothetical protein